ncbi:MAG: MarR family transcriptional regulator [Fusobacteriaceae bacterium]
MKNQVAKNGILGNFITLYNLVESEINGLLEKLGINYLEYSILVSISKIETTQYAISKKYNISTQRVHQIIKKLKKKTYISAIEEIKGGRILKKLFLNQNIKNRINEINNKIIDKLENKKVSSEELEEFNSILKILISRLDS